MHSTSHPANPVLPGRGGSKQRLAAVRRGFSLVELGVSSAMAGVLLVSMASVVVLAAKALPAADGGGAGDAAASSAGGLDQMLAELRCATNITVTTPTRISFSLADRDDDGDEETLEYSWAGAGSPLMRSQNGEAAAAVTAPLQDFALEYGRRLTTTTTMSTGTVDSGEVLFSSFNGWLGLTASLTSQSLTSTTWASQLFAINRVTIPADATRIAITRVSMELRRPNSPAGTTYTVAIHRPVSPGSSIPATQPLGTPVSTAVSTLSTAYTWAETRFTDVEWTNPAEQNFMIVLKGSSTSSAILKYLSLTTAPGDDYVFRYTTNSGSSWSGGGDNWDAPFFVYGRYERPNSLSTTVEAYAMATVGITMSTGPGSRDRVHTQVELLNKPGAPPP